MPIDITYPDGTHVHIEPDCFVGSVQDDADMGELDEVEIKVRSLIGVVRMDVRPIYPDLDAFIPSQLAVRTAQKPGGGP